MLSLLSLAAAERTQTAETYWELWQNWHKSGERFLPEILDAAEHNSRFEIFMDNVDKITRHNQEGHSWTMGVTPFTDMTPQEFKDRVVGNSCGITRHNQEGHSWTMGVTPWSMSGPLGCA